MKHPARSLFLVALALLSPALAAQTGPVPQAATNGEARLFPDGKRSREPLAAPRAAAPEALDWGAMADAVRRRPELAGRLGAVIASARKVAEVPVARRVHRYADIGRHRTLLDERARALDGQSRQEWFGLAMSDFFVSGIIKDELPLLAFAYRCTGEEAFCGRVISQLRETAAWSPLQRPGWSLLSARAPEPVPAGYWDGSWLATGQGVRGVADALELMPEGSVPPELMDKLRSLLEGEIRTIAEDWRLQRGWFRRSRQGVPQSNQWVLPTEGLIRACLVLGRDGHPAEYELGVTNLLRALDVQGARGEFNEGIHYAIFTVDSMLSAARAMAARGDRRAIEHPFLRNFPVWAAHHSQPGRFLVNCFDGVAARQPRDDAVARRLFATLAVTVQSRTAAWALGSLFDGPADDLTGLLARAVVLPAEPPERFAFYDGPARRATWRSGWADDSDGVWIRGGHPLDGHDHFDRGHVNFIAGGRALLIEAGCPSYANPRIHTHYSTVTGHNVLDVAGIVPRKAPAPVTVIRLDGGGGDVIVDPTAGYPGVERWQRRVDWTAGRLRVVDEVSFPPGNPRTPAFRWHLGAAEPVVIRADGAVVTVEWPDARLSLESSTPVTVAAEMLPDNTVNLGSPVGADHLHQCIVVRTAQPCGKWTITTRVVAR